MDTNYKFSGTESRIPEFDQVRNRLVDAGLLACAIFGFPTLIASIYRARVIGWHNLMFLQIFTYLVVVGAVILRKKLSFRSRAQIFLLSIYFIGTASLISLGLLGMGQVILITYCVFTAILFGLSASLVAMAICGLTVILVYLANLYGLNSITFDANVYVRSWSSWVMAVVGLVLLGSIMAAGLGRLHSALLESIGALKANMDDLRSINERLVGEIETRQKAEEALLASEEKYRRIVETANEGIITVDENFTVTYVNKRLTTMIGFSAEEMIGQAFDSFVYSGEISDHRNRMGSRLRGDAQRYERCFEKKDRTRLWALISATPAFNEKNEFAGAVALLTDITEQKSTEVALRETRMSFDLLVENAPDPIFILSRECFIYLNSEAVRIFGADNPFQLLGQPLLKCFPARNHDEPHERMRALIEQNQRVPLMEVECLKLDGSVLEVEVSAVPIQNAGRDDVLVFMRDISARKAAERERMKLEAQLRQAQKMEAIGTLAGGVAHDFNNILAVIIGFTELCFAGDGSKLKYNLGQILKAGLRAKELVKQILEFSRASGAERELIDLPPVVRDASKLIRSSLPTTIIMNVEITNLPGTVRGNATQLHQIMMNLCVNAAQAMAETGGSLGIRLFPVDQGPLLSDELPHLPAGRYACLTVSDSGPGMDEKTLDRIFDPFFTTKGPGEGTGLGLSVVYGLVKNFGGEIMVRSEPGSGATFIIYFPLFDQEVDRITPAPQASATGGGESILFVDDVPDLAEIGRDALANLGYRVTCLTSPMEALTLFQAAPEDFDLLITDQTMPKMTGSELARHVLQIRPDLPIILCTGYSQRFAEEKTLGIGIKRLLMKPLALTELADVVRAVLDAAR